jgi:hypothetical protein
MPSLAIWLIGFIVLIGGLADGASLAGISPPGGSASARLCSPGLAL